MNIEILVLDLCAYDDEQECVEFKENWFQPEALGEIRLFKILDGRVEKGCMGFLKTGKKGRLVPNTLLEEDIRKLTRDALRIIVTYSKPMIKETYSEIVYVAKKVEWEKIQFPDEYKYLPLPEAAKKALGINGAG